MGPDPHHIPLASDAVSRTFQSRVSGFFGVFARILAWRIRPPPHFLNYPRISHESIYADIPLKLRYLTKTRFVRQNTPSSRHKLASSPPGIDRHKGPAIPIQKPFRRYGRPVYLPPPLQVHRHHDHHHHHHADAIEDSDNDDSYTINGGYYNTNVTKIWIQDLFQVDKNGPCTTPESIHQHGFAGTIGVLLIVQMCIAYSLVSILIAVGLSGGLADLVNTNYLVISSPVLLSVPIALYLFLFATNLNPDARFTKNITFLYFILEAIKGGSDIYNAVRLIEDVMGNDHWYALVLSRGKTKGGGTGFEIDPDRLSTIGENMAGVSESTCSSFGVYLKQGFCGNPHYIIILFIVTLIITGLISIYFILSLFIHTISAENYRNKMIRLHGEIDEGLVTIISDLREEKGGRGDHLDVAGTTLLDDEDITCSSLCICSDTFAGDYEDEEPLSLVAPPLIFQRDPRHSSTSQRPLRPPHTQTDIPSSQYILADGLLDVPGCRDHSGFFSLLFCFFSLPGCLFFSSGIFEGSSEMDVEINLPPDPSINEQPTLHLIGKQPKELDGRTSRYERRQRGKKQIPIGHCPENSSDEEALVIPPKKRVVGGIKKTLDVLSHIYGDPNASAAFSEDSGSDN
jgi:hypothetical protein